MVKLSRLSEAALLGLFMVSATAFLFLFFHDIIISLVMNLIPWLTGIGVLIISFFLVWALLYFSIFLVIAIYYTIKKPMRIEESNFSMKSTKDSGEKQSGSYRTKNKDENKET